MCELAIHFIEFKFFLSTQYRDRQLKVKKNDLKKLNCDLSEPTEYLSAIRQLINENFMMLYNGD